MGEIILELFEPCVIERLGDAYNRNDRYKKAIEDETILFTQLQKSLTDEQLKMVMEYNNAVSKTLGICEKLAYRQGMRDFAAILYLDN